MRVVLTSMFALLLVLLIAPALDAESESSEPEPLVINHADPPLPSVLATPTLIDSMTLHWELTDAQMKVQFVTTELDTDNYPCNHRTGILIPDRLGLRFVEVGMEDHDPNYWLVAASSNHKPYVWAIAERSCGDSSTALEVLMSKDHGRSWRHVVTLRKPYYLMMFHEFRMSGDGKGSVSLIWDEPSLQPEFEAGLYTYRTSDWGETWDGPYLEPYVVTPAKKVQGGYHPDDDEHWRSEMKKLVKPGIR